MLLLVLLLFPVRVWLLAPDEFEDRRPRDTPRESLASEVERTRPDGLELEFPLLFFRFRRRSFCSAFMLFR